MKTSVAESKAAASAKIIHIKDPMTKDLVHEVPSSYISPTSGHRGKGHRPCLCRLYLEGRCGQGKKCKSYHVDKDFIAKKRAEHGVVIETSFITEVVVYEDTADKQIVFAVRFPAVHRTKGLDSYRSDFSKEIINPKKLCESFRETGKCPVGAECPDIHVKAVELNGLKKRRLRTPCCAHHGDRFESDLTTVTLVVSEDTSTVRDVPLSRLAENDAISKTEKEKVFALTDVCRPHITGRCKYGKSCENLHVCRVWFANNVESKSTEVSRTENSDTYSASSGVCSSNASSTSSRSPSPAVAVTEVQSKIFLNLPLETEAETDDKFFLPHWDEASPPDLGKM